MPGIQLIVYFDIPKFTSCLCDQYQIDVAKLDVNLNNLALRPFKIKLKGNTKIGSLRCAIWKAILETDNCLFKRLSGIDIQFEDKTLADDKMLVEIVRLWHNSQITIAPSTSSLKFSHTFFKHGGEHTNNKTLFRSLISNVLAEVVEKNSLEIWDSFCYTVLDFWCDHKRSWQCAGMFLPILHQFDPKPLRQYCGLRVLNVAMGSQHSRALLKQHLLVSEPEGKQHSDAILFRMGSNLCSPLMSIVYEDDLHAMSFVLQFGIDVDSPIDIPNGLNLKQFTSLYGSQSMQTMLNSYPSMQHRKWCAIKESQDCCSLPSDLVTEIATMLLGESFIRNVRKQRIHDMKIEHEREDVDMILEIEHTKTRRRSSSLNAGIDFTFRQSF